MFDQTLFVAFAKIIEELEEKKKDVSKEINESFDGFVQENSLEKKHKKQLKAAIKGYIKFCKDRTEFYDQENMYNQMLDTLCGSKCIAKE